MFKVLRITVFHKKYGKHLGHTHTGTIFTHLKDLK